MQTVVITAKLRILKRSEHSKLQLVPETSETLHVGAKIIVGEREEIYYNRSVQWALPFKLEGSERFVLESDVDVTRPRFLSKTITGQTIH